jgi:hypothetical protein
VSIKRVYIVWQNTDRTEGRGYELPFAVCELHSTALRLAKGNDVQGSDSRITDFEGEYNGSWVIAPVVPVKPTQADMSAEQAWIAGKEEKAKRDAAIDRAKALGLSDEDINALRMGEQP